MDYLQTVVYRALCKNPRLDESYAREFAEHRIKKPVDLTQLDFVNLDLVAEELGCTPDEIDAFVMVTKALYNLGKCERTAAGNRALVAAIQAKMEADYGEG